MGLIQGLRVLLQQHSKVGPSHACCPYPAQCVQSSPPSNPPRSVLRFGRTATLFALFHAKKRTRHTPASEGARAPAACCMGPHACFHTYACEAHTHGQKCRPACSSNSVASPATHVCMQRLLTSGQRFFQSHHGRSCPRPAAFVCAVSCHG